METFNQLFTQDNKYDNKWHDSDNNITYSHDNNSWMKTYQKKMRFMVTIHQSSINTSDSL
jgi:hypothetical protein